MAGTDASEISERVVCDRMPGPVWGRGRVSLLGDASHAMHPMIGQGANMAIEDAHALAAALRDKGLSPAALRAYEAARTPRCARMVSDARAQCEVRGGQGQKEGCGALAGVSFCVEAHAKSPRPPARSGRR